MSLVKMLVDNMNKEKEFMAASKRDRRDRVMETLISPNNPIQFVDDTDYGYTQEDFDYDPADEYSIDDRYGGRDVNRAIVSHKMREEEALKKKLYYETILPSLEEARRLRAHAAAEEKSYIHWEGLHDIWDQVTTGPGTDMVKDFIDASFYKSHSPYQMFTKGVSNVGKDMGDLWSIFERYLDKRSKEIESRPVDPYHGGTETEGPKVYGTKGLKQGVHRKPRY